MSSAVIVILLLALTIAMIFLGVNIGVALLTISVLGAWVFTGSFSSSAIGILGTGPFYATFDYALAVIPLFLLMGLFSNGSGASKDIYDAGFAWLGRLPGGLGIVTVIANAVFAAVTGVSIASAAVFSKIAVPQMLRYGYKKKFSVGCVVGSSALGMLIPPSLLLIVYGIVSSESIGKLFIAGIIPGILLVVNYSLGIILSSWFYPKLLGKPFLPEKMDWASRFKSVFQAFWNVGLIVLVLGGIYGGIFTPTEAGAIGCMGALLIMVFRGKFKLEEFKQILMEAGSITASVFLLFIGAQMFARMLALSGVIEDVSQFVTTLTIHPLLIVSGMLVIIMLMGTFLDIISIMLITMPIFIPIIDAFGFSLIWFGVLATIAIETGMMTPPFGMVVFVAKASLGDLVTVEDIYIGSAPFLLVLILTMAILLLNPWLVTWLPTVM